MKELGAILVDGIRLGLFQDDDGDLWMSRRGEMMNLRKSWTLVVGTDRHDAIDVEVTR